MSDKRQIRHYNEKWLELFDWFESHPNEVKRVPTGTIKRAHSFRFEFYRARVSMAVDEGLRPLYPNTLAREVTLEGENVVFRVKEKTPIAELIERSLQDEQ